MNQSMSFGGAADLGAWHFGWEALSAVGTLVAIAAALFVHFHHHSAARKEEKRRRQARTTAIAPQLAGDVMRLNWEIAQALRNVRRASRLDVAARTATMKEAWNGNGVALTIQPGAEIYGGDIEWLVDPVREKLAQLKAQVTVCNAMWQRLLIQSFDPFESREAAVGEMMKAAVHQVVDTNTSCIALLEVLESYLPEPLRALRVSLEKEAVNFLAIYNAVPVVLRARPG